jgi:hypothetical protein
VGLLERWDRRNQRIAEEHMRRKGDLVSPRAKLIHLGRAVGYAVTLPFLIAIILFGSGEPVAIAVGVVMVLIGIVTLVAGIRSIVLMSRESRN